MDWDRVRVFHAVAHAGSFTRAAERLGLSQSAISRQIGALEEDLATSLFHRHARGLVLTEQGEILLADGRRGRQAHGLGADGARRQPRLGRPAICGSTPRSASARSGWSGSCADFVERHPDIRISLIIGDSDVDLSMREADVAIRLARPTQPDLIQRRLMTVHTHIYGAPSYLERHGTPSHLRGPRSASPDRLRRRSGHPGADPELGADRRSRGRGRRVDAHAEPDRQQRVRDAAGRRERSRAWHRCRTIWSPPAGRCSGCWIISKGRPSPPTSSIRRS